MNAIIHNVASIEATFVAKEALVLLIDVLKYCTKAVGVVNGIAESGCVHHRQTQLDPAFLDLHRRRFQLYRLLLFLCKMGIVGHVSIQKQRLNKGRAHL